MKVPKEIRTFCPHCKKATIHTVKQQSKGKERKMSKGRRRFERRVTSGYGAFCRPKQNISKRYGVKVTKKATLVLKCKECGKKTLKVVGRSKKFEIER